MTEQAIANYEIYNPGRFVCGYGVLDRIGTYARDLGKKTLLVAPWEALEQVEQTIADSLQQAGVDFALYRYEGYPSENRVKAIVQAARNVGADLLIAAGGGKCLDAAKYAADVLEVRIITVPTLSATNAAYRKNSVVYTETGEYVHAHFNKRSPEVILAEASVLQRQPLRYLYSGIIDSAARSYEIEPYGGLQGKRAPYQYTTRLGALLSQFYQENTDVIRRVFTSGEPSPLVVETLTDIIGISGVGSNFTHGLPMKIFAHPFYNHVTQVAKRHTLTHGEIVGYGLLVLFTLEGWPQEAFDREYAIFRQYGYDFALADIGIETAEQLDELVRLLAKDTMPKLFFLEDRSPENLERAILAVDTYVKERRNEA
jgi:glycerol dehydrogenase